MHLEPPLHCPRCEQILTRAVRCPDCDVAPVDAHGRPVPTDPRDPLDRLKDVAGVVGPAALLGGTVALQAALHAALPGLGALAGGVLGLIGVGAIGASQRRAARDIVDAASRRAMRAQPVTIAEAIAAGGGRVAVRGELLRVPDAARGLPGAAPRFALTDGTGVALVDDDSLLVWADDPSGPHERLDALPRAGHVRVVGRARLARPDEARLVWHGAEVGYREAPTVLAFDGDASARTIAFVAPAPSAELGALRGRSPA